MFDLLPFEFAKQWREIALQIQILISQTFLDLVYLVCINKSSTECLNELAILIVANPNSRRIYYLTLHIVL